MKKQIKAKTGKKPKSKASKKKKASPIYEDYSDPTVDPADQVFEEAAHSSGALRAADLLLNIMTLRTRVSLSELNHELGAISDKTLKRDLETVQNAYERKFRKKLFRLVTAQGELWQQGTTDEQHIERISEPLNPDGVESLHRRLVAMIAMSAFQPVKNASIIHEEYKPIASKIKKNSPVRNEEILTLAERKFYAKVKGTIDFTKYDDLLNTIYTALIYTRKLQITKFTDASDAQTSVILPLCLISYNATLYLAAQYDEDKTIPRKIYLHEITKLKDVTATRDKFNYPTEFHPEEAFGKRFGLFAGNKSYRVTLRINAKNKSVYHHITERTWGPDQTLTPEPDGSAHLEFTVNDLTELAAFVLGYGAAVEVLAPDELRQSVQDVVRQLHDCYK